MARRRGERPILSPTGHPAKDKFGIVREQYIRSQAESFHNAGAKAFDKSVGIFYQVAGSFNAFFRFQVNLDQIAGTGKSEARIRRTAWTMEDGDSRALIGEHHAAKGAGTDPGKLNDIDAC